MMMMKMWNFEKNEKLNYEMSEENNNFHKNREIVRRIKRKCHQV
jgi:hypothetical protein